MDAEESVMNPHLTDDQIETVWRAPTVSASSDDDAGEDDQPQPDEPGEDMRDGATDDEPPSPPADPDVGQDDA
jgi:hypothetical protein